ncbi:arylalkylamine N-acetyltransferase 1-like isoform X1 [Neocloeon triangulifer]|uniref:arylalkylamine N-acetyltransferase 1-like isoform X1 n=1 Tax=Neocloeon triangulifer TaxID=2078957 RepID=UPI00286F2D52|nr:arylalkylamine N-acetyltransferase 1-like isoform X1 [Neocloeon triangulifer]
MDQVHAAEKTEVSRDTSVSKRGDRNYEIVRVKPEHFEDVMDFLRRNFFLDEPLNVCIQLVGDSRPGSCPELEEFSMGALQQGISLMAVSPEGKVLGAVLNAISQHEDIEELQLLAETCPNPKFKLILGLLAHIEKEADVHHRFDVDRVFEIPMLSVDSNCRGQGIATALLKSAVEMASSLNVPLVRVDCSSKFTAMAVAKLGLEPVYHMKYNTYRPPGVENPPFNPAYPHDEVASYVKRL